jgi:hypothetical protein
MKPETATETLDESGFDAAVSLSRRTSAAFGHAGKPFERGAWLRVKFDYARTRPSVRNPSRQLG